MSTPVDRKIAELQALDTPALRRLWSEAYDRPPPKRASRDLIMRALAYRVQEQVEGGLSKAALRRLAALADPDRNDTRPLRPAAPRLRPGTRLVREWRGEVHQVSVLDDGFEYQGQRYGSLSQIAREITGSRWSGPLFFGLRKSGVRTERPADDQ